MKSKFSVVLCSLFVMSFCGIAQGDELSSILDALGSVGVKCHITKDGKDVAGRFTASNNKTYGVFVEKETFIRDGKSFRRVWGGCINRPKANDLTDKQLEWILVKNGRLKFGGIEIMYGDDDSIIFVRIPVPANADGKTLESAMYMCAKILAEVDAEIPEVGASSKSETPKSESSSETIRPKTSASTASADEIIAKAEDHDGIVIGGFYLGMSPEDALVLCEHYFGHMGTIKMNRVVWKHYLDDNRDPSHLQVKTFEGIVLITDDGEYQAICGIGKKTDNRATAIEDMRSAKRVVNGFRFDSKMIRALIGQKKVMSASALGRAFFRKFDLDADIFFDDDMEFKTPERESVIFVSDWSKIFFGFNLQKDEIKFVGDLFGIRLECSESEKWTPIML